jgi:adenylate cyclase
MNDASPAGELFDGYCQRLSAMDAVIMRAYVSTQTLHPQWTGYGYTWRRELRSVREQQFARGPISQEWLSSPFNALIQRSLAGEKNPWLRRRLELGPEQRDFPALVDFYAAGATDYVNRSGLIGGCFV